MLSSLFIIICLHRFILQSLALANFNCIDVTSSRSSTNDDAKVSVGCSSSYPTMTSCGFYGVSGTNRDGGYISGNRCYAQNAWSGNGVYAKGRCCKFPGTMTCTDRSGTVYGDDNRVIVSCPSGYKVFGCTAYNKWSNFDGSYFGTTRPDQRGANINYIAPATCSAQSGYGSSSSRRTVGYARCCKPQYPMTCYTRYGIGSSTSTVGCSSGYTMTGCSAWTLWDNQNRWYISGNTCIAKSGNGGKVWASAVCCKMYTPSPTELPTESPTPSPTSYPTYNGAITCSNDDVQCDIQCGARGDCFRGIVECSSNAPCHINCDGDVSCYETKIYCPSDKPCHVSCDGDFACGDAIITWPNIATLGTISCIDMGACDGVEYPIPDPNTPLTINCGYYQCRWGKIHCPTNAKCTVNCGDDKGCWYMTIYWSDIAGLGELICPSGSSCGDMRFPVPDPNTDYTITFTDGQAQYTTIRCPSNALCTIICKDSSCHQATIEWPENEELRSLHCDFNACIKLIQKTMAQTTAADSMLENPLVISPISSKVSSSTTSSSNIETYVFCILCILTILSCIQMFILLKRINKNNHQKVHVFDEEMNV